jgi:hypothetical protein
MSTRPKRKRRGWQKSLQKHNKHRAVHEFDELAHHPEKLAISLHFELLQYFPTGLAFMDRRNDQAFGSTEYKYYFQRNFQKNKEFKEKVIQWMKQSERAKQQQYRRERVDFYVYLYRLVHHYHKYLHQFPTLFVQISGRSGTSEKYGIAQSEFESEQHFSTIVEARIVQTPLIPYPEKASFYFYVFRTVHCHYASYPLWLEVINAEVQHFNTFCFKEEKLDKIRESNRSGDLKFVSHQSVVGNYFDCSQPESTLSLPVPRTLQCYFDVGDFAWNSFLHYHYRSPAYICALAHARVTVLTKETEFYYSLLHARKLLIPSMPSVLWQLIAHYCI